MLDFEQDFYKFVKGQLDKKRGNKQLVENEQLYNEDTVQSKKSSFYQGNRLLSENIQKVLQNERKKMKISKITKEQHFENKMKDFTQMDTFIDVKFFLKNLNDQQMKKNRKKIPKSIKRSKSHTDKEDLFDYAEIVQKSKKFIENSRHFRSKPKIELYLQADNENSQRTKVIEDGRSTSEKFYTGIDQLIIDINHKTVLSEMDRKYERERKKHRDTMSSEQIIKSFIPLDFGKDEIAIEAGKNFKEQSQKVLQLLERTTKMLYKNKLPQPPNQKLLKQQQEQLKELKQYQPNTIDARSQKQILVKSRSESNDMRFPQVNGKLINPLVRRIVPLQQASHASLPEIQPSSFLSQREDKKFENLHYFKSPQNQSKQDDHHNNSSHQSVSPDIKSQIGEFIQQLDDAKQQFQKLYPSDSQIQKIQNNMSKRMMQIGKIPLESFNYLTKKKVQIPKKFELRGKKNKVLQIL